MIRKLSPLPVALLSPLLGAECNVEFLAHLVTGGRSEQDTDAGALVADAVALAVARRSEA